MTAPTTTPVEQPHVPWWRRIFSVVWSPPPPPSPRQRVHCTTCNELVLPDDACMQCGQAFHGYPECLRCTYNVRCLRW